jgi:hypothetical protein
MFSPLATLHGHGEIRRGYLRYPRGNFRAKDPSFPEDLHGLLMLTADLSQGKRLRADGTLKMRGQGMHADDSFERPPRGRGFQPRDLLAGYYLSRRDR